MCSTCYVVTLLLGKAVVVARLHSPVFAGRPWNESETHSAGKLDIRVSDLQAWGRGPIWAADYIHLIIQTESYFCQPDTGSSLGFQKYFI